MKEVCRIIRDLREDSDLTQSEVASYLGVTQQCYFSYESGRCALPVWVLIALSQLYHVSADYLLGLDTNYQGGTNLMEIYHENITLYNVVYEMQKIKKSRRQELLSYMQFLINDGKK